MITNWPVRQLAYVVSDVRKAAQRHGELCGSGPFFVADDIPYISSVYRGVEQPVRHSAAFGQWGDLQVEFVQPTDGQPSALTEVLERSRGRDTLHHVAIIVPDPMATAAAFAATGYPTAWHGKLPPDVDLVMVDTMEPYGHMIELYAPCAFITDFFEMVRHAAIGFDGSDLLRPASF